MQNLPTQIFEKALKQLVSDSGLYHNPCISQRVDFLFIFKGFLVAFTQSLLISSMPCSI